MKKIYLITVFVIVFFGFGLLLSQPVQAQSAGASGWAWSENIGWISFSCQNQGCGTSNYGVNVDISTGQFSGYAWSENIGWISFNRSDTGTPPAAPYNGSETYISKVDLTTNQVSGWARALAYGDGWDGWIKLGGSNYGVTLNRTTNEFEGWAWSDMVIGWISFNCKNQNVCPTSNYQVKLTLPAANPQPIGNHDAANCDYIGGWACDASNYNTPIDVHLYRDGPAGSGGTYVTAVSANIAREAGVGALCGGNVNHGFIYITPDSLKDNIAHQIYVYAIDIPGGSNPLLGNSPKTLGPCTPPSMPCTLSVNPNQVSANNSDTWTWSGTSNPAGYATKRYGTHNGVSDATGDNWFGSTNFNKLGGPFAPTSGADGIYARWFTISDPGTGALLCTSNTATLTVYLPTYVIDPPSASKPVGQTQQFTGWYDKDGPGGTAYGNQNVTNSASWTSSNTSIATINSSGLATCVSSSASPVTITSVYNTITATASLTCSTACTEGGNCGACSSSGGGGYGSDVTPAMTSNSAPSPNVTSASSYLAGYTYSPYSAFDGNPTGESAWVTNQTVPPTLTGWLKFDFGSGNTKTVTKYRLIVQYPGYETWVQPRAPKTWTFEGSNNNSSWSILDSRSNIIDWVSGTWKEYTFSNSTGYRYYRINVTANNGAGDYLQITEMEMMEGSGGGTCTQLCDHADCTRFSKPCPCCGDGTCNGTETCSTCPADCVVCPPSTLSVIITANPPSGTAPLTGVVLTATVGGSAVGTINYTFYCDRADTGTNITAGYVHKLDGTSVNPYPTLAGVCNSVYTNPGTYKAKVIVERDGAPPAQAQATVTVGSCTEGGNCGPCSSSGGGGYGSDVTPAMTSNTAPTPNVVSASYNYGDYYGPFKVFDHATAGDGVLWIAPSASAQWLKFDFGSGNGKKINKYTIQNGDYDPGVWTGSSPKNWTFEGSNDDSYWIVLDTKTNETGWSVQQKRTYTFDNTNIYRYYRINAITNNGNTTWLFITEMEMMEGSGGGTCTQLCDHADCTRFSKPCPCGSSISAEIKANGEAGSISVNYGDSVDITWSSTNANSCSVSPNYWPGTSGSQPTGNLTSSQTYTLNCTNLAGGSASDLVEVRVGLSPKWKEIFPW